MNRLLFLRVPLSRALGLLVATLMLSACAWDNPVDPQALNYQGYTSVMTVDEIEAVTSDGTEMIYQSFLVNEVLEAQAYRLEIATDEGFSSVIYRKDTLTSNYMGANASLNRGSNYYWKGSAKKGGVWGKWTEGRLFKLRNSITSMSPANGSITPNTKPTFSWATVNGAAKYEIQIADSVANLAGSPTVNVPRPGTRYTPATALTNLETYHWRVRAVDGDDQAGAWSGVSSLQVEWGALSGLRPTDGSSIWNTKPTFSWDALAGADKYEIQIADSKEALADIRPIEITGGDTSYTPTMALANLETYYWRVRALDSTHGQTGVWNMSTFRVEWGVISNLDPADGSTTSNTKPTFSWDALAGAGKYEIQVADSKEALAGIRPIEITGGDTSYTPTTVLTNLETYYWRVRALDSTHGQTGVWNMSTFRVEWGAVSNLDPPDGDVTAYTKPTFSWTAVNGANRYQIQIADDGVAPTTNPLVDRMVNAPDTSYTATADLTKNQTYSWRVRAEDIDGQVGNWSAVHSLRIGYAVGDIGPAGGKIIYNQGSVINGWQYLEAAPKDQGRYVWGGWGGHETGGLGIPVGGTGTSIGSGKSNTKKIVAKLGSNQGYAYAAKICEELVLNEYDDWFLPSLDELNELEKIYYGDGDGFSHRNYPYYWSSSEFSLADAWYQSFYHGYQLEFPKDRSYNVRAVRAF